jgi:hypothetical protein
MQDMHDRMTLDMDPHSRAVSNSHVLTIHGDRDSTIPVEDGYSFHERIPVRACKLCLGLHAYICCQLSVAAVMEKHSVCVCGLSSFQWFMTSGRRVAEVMAAV